MLKTNGVSMEFAVAPMLRTAFANEHPINSHPWPLVPNRRTLIFIRCDRERWAWSALYDILCPCADEGLLQYVSSGKTQLTRCVNESSSFIRELTRSGRTRPLVEEVFSEGLFSFSRDTLRQQSRAWYSAWKEELATKGEPHQECLDEWITMFDEAGDAPWGRDDAWTPIWKASPSRLLYAPQHLL